VFHGDEHLHGADGQVHRGAGPILHDDLLPQPGRQLVGDEARRDVGGAAGRGAVKCLFWNPEVWVRLG
jgi:hypothetical protein